MAKKIKFEQALKELEDIVNQLEEGEQSLDKLLKLYEEGTKLARFCSKKLEEAEKKVEILKHENGKPVKKPFQLQEGKQNYEGTEEENENKEESLF